MPHITRIKITDYRGIKTVDQEVPAAGLTVTGGNHRGKTSFINAVMAALAARDVHADAIRHGADSAEILVDLDNYNVRRSITPKGTTLTVKRDGFKADSPQERLNELFGGERLVDPLELFLAKDEARRRMVLAAMPMEVTEADVVAWLGRAAPVSLRGHGLEVVATLRKAIADQRKDAKKAEIAALVALKNAEDRASALAPALEGAPSLEDAAAGCSLAADSLAEMRANAKAAAKVIASMADQRAEAEKLEAEAAALELQATARPDEAQMNAAGEGVIACVNAVDQAKRALAAAQANLDAAKQERDALAAQNHAADLAGANAATARSSAYRIRASLEKATAMEVSPSRIKLAEDILAEAMADQERAQAAERARAASREISGYFAEWKATRAEVDRLESAVDALDAAPGVLASRSGGIRGVTVTDAGVLLDGTAIEKLSGSEQMHFAISIAKRANEKAKILIVDGLERLDPEEMERFVALATADSWQLLGTRVSSGDMVIEAITP